MGSVTSRAETAGPRSVGSEGRIHVRTSSWLVGPFVLAASVLTMLMVLGAATEHQNTTDTPSRAVYVGLAIIAALCFGAIWARYRRGGVIITATQVQVRNTLRTHTVARPDVAHFEFELPVAVAVLRNGRRIRCNGIFQAPFRRRHGSPGRAERLVAELNQLITLGGETM